MTEEKIKKERFTAETYIRDNEPQVYDRFLIVKRARRRQQAREHMKRKHVPTGRKPGRPQKPDPRTQGLPHQM